MSVNSSSLPSAWDLGFRRNLNDHELKDLMSLLATLDFVVLVSSMPNRRRWLLEYSGNFSCKSFARDLMDNPSLTEFIPCTAIWMAEVPKVRI